ncbi:MULTISPECIES: hypothetical protein [Priestia]|nr:MULTISPECIES: hypothetical protein [Priestia]MCM3770287.1 hypothetical protein [Priestia aryabhattai]MDY0940659.1 hypothetical protein [Priestia megaterium]
MFLAIIEFIAVFITLCSLEAKLRTIVQQNERSSAFKMKFAIFSCSV